MYVDARIWWHEYGKMQTNPYSDALDLNEDVCANRNANGGQWAEIDNWPCVHTHHCSPFCFFDIIFRPGSRIHPQNDWNKPEEQNTEV